MNSVTKGYRPNFRDQGRELVRILSTLLEFETLGPGAEMDRAFDFVKSELSEVGIVSKLVTNKLGVPTLLATIDSGSAGPHIMLQGHMDVVPVENDWDTPPFTPTISGGMLYARGVCDMKAGIAAYIVLMKMLTNTGGLQRGALTILLDADEEVGSETGLIPYIQENGLSEFDWAICAEPTAMRPYLGNRGLLWASIGVRGSAAHAGMPHAGKNPVPVLAQLITELPEPPVLDGILGGTGPSLTPTVLTAGEVVNSIAASATVMIDRRVVPPEDPAAIRKELDAFIDQFQGRFSDFGINIDFFKDWPPCLLDSESTLAQAAAAVAAERGRDASFGFDDACNDASFIAAAGVPTLIWGPGSPEMAHVSNEGIELDELYVAPEMYYAAIEKMGLRVHNDRL